MSVIAHLWQSTLCVGVAMLLALWFGRGPARLRYGIWIAATAKFLLPFSLIVAVGRILGEWAVPATRVPAALQWLGRSFSTWSQLPGTPAEHGAPGILAAGLGVVWLAGACAVGGWRWRSWRDVDRLAEAAAPLAHGREYEALQRVLRRRTRPPRIELLSSGVDVEPAALGVVRARVMWPAALSERLSDGEIDAIMAHEVCHVVRRDNAIGVLRAIVETLFWFHPVVWWLGGRLVAERERACDEEVVQMGMDRRSYAESILEVCRFCLRVPASAASGVGASHLARRLERIMRDQPMRMTVASRATLTVMSAALLVGPLGAGVVRAHRPPDPMDRSAQQAPASAGDGKELVMPRVIKEVKPVYTQEAMQERIQGSVLLSVVVEADGTVGDVEVTKSLDTVHGLDEAAITAVRQWRFAPGRRDGKPVAVTVDIEMTFTLK